MALDEYYRKRDSAARPSQGQGAEEGRWRSAWQKHAATRLHYDFRLELDGVLRAGPCQRPSFDPSRSAWHADGAHPSTGDFEGIIPKGIRRRHRGPVDLGTWKPLGIQNKDLRAAGSSSP